MSEQKNKKKKKGLNIGLRYNKPITTKSLIYQGKLLHFLLFQLQIYLYKTWHVKILYGTAPQITARLFFNFFPLVPFFCDFAVLLPYFEEKDELANRSQWLRYCGGESTGFGNVATLQRTDTNVSCPIPCISNLGNDTNKTYLVEDKLKLRRLNVSQVSNSVHPKRRKMSEIHHNFDMLLVTTKFHAFYVTLRSLSCSKERVQSHLLLVLRSGHLPSGYPTKTLC